MSDEPAGQRAHLVSFRSSMNKVEHVQSVAAAKAHSVTAQRTPTPPARIRAAIAAAYRRETGREATGPTLDVLLAHVSHETGRGDAMFNYNFGGIKGAGPSGAVAHYRTREVGPDDQDYYLVDGFRAYRSLGEGAADYLRTMRERYPSALAAATRGDLDGFAAALKQRGYFTAHLDDYAAALRGLLRTPYAASTHPEPPATAPPLAAVCEPSFVYATESLVGRVLDAVAAMGAEVGAPIARRDEDAP